MTGVARVRSNGDGVSASDGAPNVRCPSPPPEQGSRRYAPVGGVLVPGTGLYSAPGRCPYQDRDVVTVSACQI
jgi:hypothetical protein